MVGPSSKDRTNEKFVQWKEPLQGSGGTVNDDGNDSTSRSRKNKHSRRGKSSNGAAGATLQGGTVEESRHIGRASAAVPEAGRPNSSPTVLEAPSSNPAPRFVPPQRIINTRSSVPVSRPHTTERAPEHITNMVAQRGQRRPPPLEEREGQNESTALEHDGTSAHHSIPAP